MTLLREVHERHDARFEERGGREFVTTYGRPDRSHGAVRNVVGVTEMAYDVLAITGEDRVEYVDNAVSNNVPTTDGQGSYALLLTPQGRIRTDMYVFNGGERLLLFLPPGQGEPIAEDWSEKTFIQDVEIDVVSDSFGVFGVHGPEATEKVASVFTDQTPDEQLTFTRGSMGDAGVTVIRTDAPTGEVGYEVVCDASVAEDVWDSLENRGLNAAAFGLQAWRSLTLEAGTPLFETELQGRTPAELGLSRLAADAEEAAERDDRLVGLELEGLPERGASVTVDGDPVGAVTRAADCPMRDEPVALAVVDYDTDGDLAVETNDGPVDTALADLPFVDGGQRSARLPEY